MNLQVADPERAATIDELRSYVRASHDETYGENPSRSLERAINHAVAGQRHFDKTVVVDAGCGFAKPLVIACGFFNFDECRGYDNNAARIRVSRTKISSVIDDLRSVGDGEKAAQIEKITTHVGNAFDPSLYANATLYYSYNTMFRQLEAEFVPTLRLQSGARVLLHSLSDAWSEAIKQGKYKLVQSIPKSEIKMVVSGVHILESV